MQKETQVIDKFEYKGKSITVHKDSDQECYFTYVEDKKEIRLSLKEIKNFITSSFSHTTIDNNVVDLIEKSVKINNFLFNLKDLNDRLKKYD
jgi:hypothetical protein